MLLRIGTMAGYRFGMAIFAIRILVLLLSAVAVALAVVPIVVLIDLVSGGSGYGLCPGGIEACSRPFSTGAEMVIILGLALFAVVASIRILMRVARRLQQQTQG